MQSNAVALAANVSSVAAQAAQLLQVGGRYALIMEATTYPTTVTLQTQSVSGKWVPVNSSNITADGVTAYDIPAGQVRLFLSGGSASALYATLVKVPY